MLFVLNEEKNPISIFLAQLPDLKPGCQLLIKIGWVEVDPSPRSAQERILTLSSFFTQLQVLSVCRAGNEAGSCEGWPVSFDVSQWDSIAPGFYSIHPVLVTADRGWISLSNPQPVPAVLIAS